MATVPTQALGGGALILVRKTGYLGYLAFDKFYGWFRDVTDVAGFSRERRTFLSLQIEASRTLTLEELWAHIGEALEMLKFDRAELHLKNRGTAPQFPKGEETGKNGDEDGENRNSEGSGKNQDSAPFSLREKRAQSLIFPSKGADAGFSGPERRRPAGGDSPRPTSTKIVLNGNTHADETVRVWARGYYRRASDGQHPEGMLKIDLPLDSNGARLILVKDINRDPLNFYTLRRLEHLRRTLISNLARLQK